MLKKLLLTVSALVTGVLMYAQDAPTGGVKGTVINRNDRQPVENARLSLMQGAGEVANAVSAQDGSFLIGNLPDGMYTLIITAPDFMEQQVGVTVVDGYVKNMFTLSLTGQEKLAELEDAATAELDMDDSGFGDNPSVLFDANDVFANVASFGFSSVRFKQRGYNSETQEVYLAGVRMNDALTGYGPYSLWSGLNEAMRAKDTSVGLGAADYNIGGYNGTTNVTGTASSVRKGLRGSILTNSALYRLRVMASYATGVMDNGWAFAANVSARLGGNDWVKGMYYRSFAYYLAADKHFGDEHTLSAVFFATPGERGAQNASTQEVYDLVKDNMYNSNWGYQNGKVRNARVRKTHEPVAILKYDFTPSDVFNVSATALFRFGSNGYTALDWYDAYDPRPDYYRNLPSYFWMDNKDYGRDNLPKYAMAAEAWSHPNDYPTTAHINWDRLYNVNRANIEDGEARSKYVQEERHVDQKDFNFAVNGKWRPLSWMTLVGGGQFRMNTTENYKILADLLGGSYYLNIDNFAERDFAANPEKLQNDLDYYLSHNMTAQKKVAGEKYGYDYLAQVRSLSVWGNMKLVFGNFSGSIGGRVGFQKVWREGLLRKGLFPGTWEEVKAINDKYGLNMQPALDAGGRAITSYGKSDAVLKPTGAVKLNLNYIIGGNMRVYANVGYFRDAPSFNQCFISPRTRNTVTPNISSVKTFATDLNWQYSGNGFNVRLTGYYSRINDITKVMSAYDDVQNAFSNFVLTGIGERHYGMELGFRTPTPLPNLNIRGALALGRAEYVGNPTMTQTIDNSAAPVTFNGESKVEVAYWAKSPVYKRTPEGFITPEIDHYQQHYVPSTPQLAADLGLTYFFKYWFFELDFQYFDWAYLDMNPLYRTDYATAGPDKIVTPTEIEYMTTQEKFDGAFMMNISVGKSWFIKHKYQLGFSLNGKNLLNNKLVKTGGYEQTRIVDNTVSKEQYYRFDPKYFYMSGINYMLNVYFRF
ncbi:MAG: TonB-dependent receptor [Bacteroidales bacterium]|nr:TonB-dependent receptor [Bacteroidales bacterium]